MLANFRQALSCALIISAFGAFTSVVSAAEWVSRINLTQAEDQALVDDLKTKGWVPIYSKVTIVDGRRSFDVVYLKMTTRWEYRSYYDDATYQRINRQHVAAGMQLVSHHTYVLDGVTYHNAIWHGR